MIRETIVISKTLWMALKKQLIGDYNGNEYHSLNYNCEVILINNPKMHIVACANDDVVNVTITYNPLDVALDIRRSRERGGRRYSTRSRRIVHMPLE
ncbi:hypothetical protein [Vulcanisaeta distributa]|uniref:hypothetical protein n=1 Tax=Vulcanisaeta distributa TaxID=164451 RepID=UPI0006D2160F|nr:hypothetical protein [Vulcanisaeta distributa]